MSLAFSNNLLNKYPDVARGVIGWYADYLIRLLLDKNKTGWFYSAYFLFLHMKNILSYMEILLELLSNNLKIHWIQIKERHSFQYVNLTASLIIYLAKYSSVPGGHKRDFLMWISLKWKSRVELIQHSRGYEEEN